MSNILTRNGNFIGWQIDYLSTEPLRSNAPVTHVLWQCENLPDGLTLSADGKISGCPTAAGNYACTITVTTNWGSATKIINIRVIE